MVQRNTAVQIGCFQHLSDLDTMKNDKIKYTKQTKN